jgi:hypothetical protein
MGLQLEKGVELWILSKKKKTPSLILFFIMCCIMHFSFTSDAQMGRPHDCEGPGFSACLLLEIRWQKGQAGT